MEEVEAGLWDKKKTTKPKPYKINGGKSVVVKEAEVWYGGLFDGVEEGE